MRKPLIAGNWKMYKTINEAIQLTTAIKRELLDLKAVDIVVCAPFTTLSSVFEVIMETDIGLGAQNLFWEKAGAYTGEISPLMLKDCGAEFVIIGHSERRKYFFETDETVNKKVKAALDVGLFPIVCVGETLDERQAQKTIEIVKGQLEGCFKEIDPSDMRSITIAYEPVWAIGTGATATPQIAQEVQAFIRGWIAATFSEAISNHIRILYGGSVKPANIKELMQQPDIDGALVGGASLDASTFIAIVKNSIPIPK